MPVSGQSNTATSKRVIYYYQTQYNGSSSNPANYVSLSPIWASANLNPGTGKPYVTDVLVGAFHLGAQSDGSSIHLNDNQPSDPIFTTMWQEVATLQSRGVNAVAMLGGAAQGSYASLFNSDGTLTSFYGVLKQTLQTYKLNGIDLDIEEPVSLANVETLINQLHADFGSSFVITMAPVAAALEGGTDPFSGISYSQLYQAESANISWFNVQFYSGFGSLSSPANYQSIINSGYPANKVVAGMIANPADGSGYVDIGTVESTVRSLVAQYSNFGGVDAWEYFNANPGGTAAPAEWGTDMAQTMGASTNSTAVNLASFYNVNGIYTDGSTFSSSGGIDGVGNAYSATALGTTQTWNGATFTFGAPNAVDAVAGQTVTLPPGNFSRINLLATGVEGNQTSQSFKVTYADGTSTTFTQNLSDWSSPQNYTGESTAVSMSYRNEFNGTKDNRTFHLYGYSFTLNNAKSVRSIQLPANRNVVVFGAALVP
jgi:hypothetical protein